ncbi:MAG: bifunctional adenosylcobinamide kinase/adenosylcobinamide-phosphate guanylyltransferase [Mariprofundus sp.]|nr:bifunctional adenosylcobinamide kinase/adenosylcobinamide-phosphate guanylyltransferase [Mariprofundus sp.]
MGIVLILGGARSGKSSRAEVIAKAWHSKPYYIATAPLIDDDPEWLARIEHHRRQRGELWKLIEEELALAAVLQNSATTGQVVLVDCMTLWLSNLLFAERNMGDAVEQLCALLPKLAGTVILVANEVGMGLVPDSAEGRIFRDAQGHLNQKLAALADHVEFVAAGLPICLKGEAIEC